MRATDGTMRIAAIQSEPSVLRVRFVSALTCAVLAIAAFFLTRRAIGALEAPLAVVPMLVTALLVAVWAILVRELSQRNAIVTALAILGTLMFAVACSYPGTRIIDWLVWPLVMFSTVLLPPLSPQVDGDLEAVENVPVKIMTDAGEEVEADSELVLQRVTRCRTADGQETISGQLLAEFAPGERQSTVYVGFCPPFERLPEIEVNLADDFDATVKPTQIRHNGAQFEVRLAEPAEECFRVLLEFAASDGEPA
jgi:hypothetical protein